jgi:NitT/TauT family transport system permease protein
MATYPPSIMSRSTSTAATLFGAWSLGLRKEHNNSWVTLQEVLAGFALGVMVGLPVALAIVSWPLAEKALYPLLVGSQVVPKIAIAPLFIIWFGFGIAPKIILAFMIAFFPIVIATVVGLRSVGIETLYLARSMGAGRTSYGQMSYDDEGI